MFIALPQLRVTATHETGAMARSASVSDRVTPNPNWSPAEIHAGEDDGAIEAFHASLPGFAATPLVEVPELAARLNVGQVWVKHERERLGLPSFKVVGASWAVNCALAELAGVQIPRTFGALRELATTLSAETLLTTATDGNHGRAVAHMARLLGVACRISVPVDMARARIAAIASEGAAVQVVDGSYDHTVARVAAAAFTDPAQVVVSDTSWPGYETVPATVAAGYRTIFREAFEQLAAAGGGSFDVAFAPAGVGAFASSAVSNLVPHGCAVVTVEPTAADCVRRSLARGVPVSVPGPHDSIMAGLNCGEVSRIAWPVLRAGVRVAVAVSDAEAADAMRTLAAAGIPSGESGAAALAGAELLVADGAGAALLGRRADASILLLDTEGVTDPERYDAIVGVSAPS